MNTAEDIIISKRYFELTSSEKEVVRDLVSNEEEYEAMRWFLISTEESFAEEKIEPSSDLKKGVMAHLQQKQGAPKTIWLNGVGAFLFPAEKKFYQYPALQIAAVAVLFISVVAVYNSGKELDQTLAVNDQSEISSPEENTLSENETISQEENDSGNDQPEQQIVSGVVTGEGTKTGTLDKDLVPADEAYYRDMSVAEEIKYAEADEDEVLADELQDVSSTGAGEPAQPNTVVLDNIVSRNESKSELSKSKDEDKNLKQNSKKETNLKTGSTSADQNAPAGYAYTSTEKTVTEAEKEEATYLTGSAGGVYRETAADSVSSDKTKADAEEGQVKFSISDTKILKKLVFVVK